MLKFFYKNRYRETKMNIKYVFTLMSLALLISPVCAEGRGGAHVGTHAGSHEEVKKISEHALRANCSITDPRCK